MSFHFNEGNTTQNDDFNPYHDFDFQKIIFFDPKIHPSRDNSLVKDFLARPLATATKTAIFLIIILLIFIFTAIFTYIFLLTTISNEISSLDGAIDPDEHRDALGLIASRGFIPQAYHILTPDGYVLELHRIVNPLLERPGTINLEN